MRTGMRSLLPLFQILLAQSPPELTPELTEDLAPHAPTALPWGSLDWRLLTLLGVLLLAVVVLVARFVRRRAKVSSTQPATPTLAPPPPRVELPLSAAE